MQYDLRCIDGSEGLKELEDKSIKLLYGSPPYPNAVRNYENWSSKEYIGKITPFIENSLDKLTDDGFIVINIKANRDKHNNACSTRSLVVERLAIKMEDDYGLRCVDIEVWYKKNPIPGGLRCACQDAYEQILWFSKTPNWKINLDDIRRPYSSHSLDVYESHVYKPRSNGVPYVKKEKVIAPNENGALPINVVVGGVQSKRIDHQAAQPNYLPNKYILACTNKNDWVVDPWVGSGTTGEEAIKLGRNFIGFDIDEKYIDCSRKRIEGVLNVSQLN